VAVGVDDGDVGSNDQIPGLLGRKRLNLGCGGARQAGECESKGKAEESATHRPPADRASTHLAQPLSQSQVT
jgi:hypothetical protein